MSRWTEAQKELQGYKRKLAYGRQTVSLKVAPWEENKDESNRDSAGRIDKRTEEKVREGT